MKRGMPAPSHVHAQGPAHGAGTGAGAGAATESTAGADDDGDDDMFFEEQVAPMRAARARAARGHDPSPPTVPPVPPATVAPPGIRVGNGLASEAVGAHRSAQYPGRQAGGEGQQQGRGHGELGAHPGPHHGDRAARHGHTDRAHAYPDAAPVSTAVVEVMRPTCHCIVLLPVLRTIIAPCASSVLRVQAPLHSLLSHNPPSLFPPTCRGPLSYLPSPSPPCMVYSTAPRRHRAPLKITSPRRPPLDQ